MFRLSSNCRVRNGGPAEDEAAAQRGWMACLGPLLQRLQISKPMRSGSHVCPGVGFNATLG